MARFCDDPLGYGPNVYTELRAREEALHARRGGRLVLAHDGRALSQHQPSPLLRALRAGEPVEVMDWQVPRWARPGGGSVRNVRLMVHPAGYAEEVGAASS